MALLGVNIDHVATLRQARYRGANTPGEPDPARAVHEAELGGADIITVHLREDRRHINDADLARIADLTRVRLNLEMSAAEEMVGIAIKTRPHLCTLVPEGRQEVTTEGGLDVAQQRERLTSVVSRLHGAGIRVSAFIDADARQVDASHAAGFDAGELHTGPYAEAFARAGGDFADARLRDALEQLRQSGHRLRALGLRFNAGHALNYANVGAVAALPGLEELHIGHAIVSRAVWIGLREAVREMKLAAAVHA
jgi:pyridoxine 5-phosphate synthase